jgi:hypothetical protein
MTRRLFSLCFLFLLLLSWRLCRAEQLTTASASFLPLPSTTSKDTTASATSDASTTTSSPTTTPLHIFPQTTASDLIGLAKVSGFYGPGTWSGWFLTVCASWVRLFRGKQKFDLNTWLYILGMNWAAIDLLRNLRELGNLRQAGAEDWMRDCATIGAAYTVVFWGLSHAICQFFVFFAKEHLQGLTTLAAGLLLPSISLTVAASVFCFDTTAEINDIIPAVYYDGSKAGASGMHAMVLCMASVFGVCCLVIYTGVIVLFVVIIFFIGGWKLVPESVRDRIEDPMSSVWEAFKTMYLTGIPILIFATIILSFWDQFWIFWLWIAYTPILLFLFCLFWPVAGASFILPFCITYACQAYLIRSVSVSQSCFFMPCAPQSITENDQAFALLAGLFAFLVPEVGIPFVHRIRENRRTRLEFLQDVDRRFELARMDRTAGEADTSGSRIRGPSRVNSGIAVEEGRARVGLARRVRSDLNAQAVREGFAPAITTNDVQRD